MKEVVKNIYNKLINIDNNYLVLLLLNIVIFLPFISKIFAFGHDTLYHVAQIDAMTESIKTLNFTKIASLLGNSLGYAPAIFYPKLPHYICTFINILTFNLNTIYSIKLYFILISFLSSIFMYKLIKLLTNNNNSAVLGTLLYITMPYYITDIYIRGALSEFAVFLFLPIIFYALINLVKDNNQLFYIYFIIGYVGLMNSHLVLSVYATILIIIFMLFNIKKYLSKIKQLLISSIIIIIMVLPNIILLLEHKMTNLYVVFSFELMELSASSVSNRGINLIDLFIPHKTDIFNFINVVAIIFFILGIVYLYRNRNKKIIKDNKNTYYGIIVFTIISIFLSLKIFPYEYLPKLLLSIQFAFRNSTFTAFGISIIASLGILNFKNKQLINKVLILSIIFSIIIAFYYVNKSDFKDITKEELSYDIYAQIGWNREYLTKYTYNNIDYFINRDNSIKGATTKELDSNFPSLKFRVKNIKEKTKIELPRLYYLGYKITFNNKKIDYKCNELGFIEIELSKEGIVNLSWTGTKLYNITRLIRIIAIIMIVSILFIRRRQNN